MSDSSNINNYFLKKLAKLPVSAKTPMFDKLSAKTVKLTSLGIDNDEKFRKYFFIKKAAKGLRANLSDKDRSQLLVLDINNMNDAYFHIVNLKLKANNIKKKAYPCGEDRRHHLEGEFDINEWLKVVHLVYDAVAKKEMTKQNALDYYSNFLNIEEDEDIKFKKWFKYYSDGEHLKYSSKEDEQMKKKSVYMSNLGQGGSPYYHGGGSAYLNKGTGNNMPGDSFGDELTFDRASELAERGARDTDAFRGWKDKLHTAIRRIDKLLRTDRYIGPETYRVLAEHLMNLSLQVHMLKLGSTLTDVTYKAANSFTKLGHTEGAELLKKLAQEVPEQPQEPNEGSLNPPTPDRVGQEEPIPQLSQEEGAEEVEAAPWLLRAQWPV